jgi:hypothetical protein
VHDAAPAAANVPAAHGAQIVSAEALHADVCEVPAGHTVQAWQTPPFT